MTRCYERGNEPSFSISAGRTLLHGGRLKFN